MLVLVVGLTPSASARIAADAVVYREARVVPLEHAFSEPSIQHTLTRIVNDWAETDQIVGQFRNANVGSIGKLNRQH